MVPPDYPRRPPRLELFAQTRPFYFVTFNTARRSPILDDAELHETFVRFCVRARDEHSVAVGRYVLMPDHVHLFVAMPETGRTLESWVQSLKSFLGKKLLHQGIPKPHWQEGFFDHVLRSGESYSEKWEYVRQNPVRANLCRSLDDWPWQGEIAELPF